MKNQCPNCGDEAMSPSHKLLLRPHVCQKCGAEVRMNLVYTIVLSLVYFGLSVQALFASGFSSGGMVRVLVYTAIFIGVCMFIPFEVKKTEE